LSILARSRVSGFGGADHDAFRFGRAGSRGRMIYDLAVQRRTAGANLTISPELVELVRRQDRKRRAVTPETGAPQR
jgi:hypothetical protein